jgi:hypothetical protein
MGFADGIEVGHVRVTHQVKAPARWRLPKRGWHDNPKVSGAVDLLDSQVTLLCNQRRNWQPETRARCRVVLTLRTLGR